MPSDFFHAKNLEKHLCGKSFIFSPVFFLDTFVKSSKTCWEFWMLCSKKTTHDTWGDAAHLILAFPSVHVIILNDLSSWCHLCLFYFWHNVRQGQSDWIFEFSIASWHTCGLSWVFHWIQKMNGKALWDCTKKHTKKPQLFYKLCSLCICSSRIYVLS